MGDIAYKQARRYSGPTKLYHRTIEEVFCSYDFHPFRASFHPTPADNEMGLLLCFNMARSDPSPTHIFVISGEFKFVLFIQNLKANVGH